MTNPLAKPSVGPGPFSPPPINSVEDTGLSALWLQDLTLKDPLFTGLYERL